VGHLGDTARIVGPQSYSYSSRMCFIDRNCPAWECPEGEYDRGGKCPGDKRPEPKKRG